MSRYVQRHDDTNEWLSLANNPKPIWTLWAFPPSVYGSQGPGLWGYWQWFMLLRVYIQALN